MTSPNPKRRFLRFSLRALLLFVVVLSVPLGWFAWEMQRARRQRVAVDRIWELGGEVFYDYKFDENGTWTVGLAEPPL